MELDDHARPICVMCHFGWCDRCLRTTRPGGCACPTCRPEGAQ